MEQGFRAKAVAFLITGMSLILTGCAVLSDAQDAGSESTTSSVTPSISSVAEEPSAPDADPTRSSDESDGSDGSNASSVQGLGEEFETWVGVDLPVPITNLRASGGRVAYEAEVEGGTTVMVVIDAATGEELARFDSDQAGRIGGVQSTPEILDGVLFVVGPENDNRLNVIEAIELASLESLWSAPFRLPSPPDRCGDYVCITDTNGNMSRYEATTGTRQGQARFTDTRVLGTAGEGFQIRPVSSGRIFAGLRAYEDFGFTPLWRHSARELQEAAGQQVSANGGWAASFDETSNIIAQWLGPPWPYEVEASDTQPFPDRPLGAAFGIDVDTGEIKWSVPNVGYCGSLPGVGFMPLCRRSSTIGATFEEASFETDLVQVVEIATGAVVWSHSFTDEVPLFDVELSVADGAFVVDVAGERVARESFAGLDTDGEDTDTDGGEDEPGVFTCELVAAEMLDLDGIPITRHHRDFVVPPREAPCLSDGTILTPEDALTRFGELPSGFAVDAADGWSVWVDEAGLPNGILIPEPSS